MLMIFFAPRDVFKIKTFPQCIPYIYILIYIKGSKFLQTAVYIILVSALSSAPVLKHSLKKSSVNPDILTFLIRKWKYKFLIAGIYK